MVGKTYLRYVPGPQSGAVVSSAALTLDATVAQPTYGAGALGHMTQQRGPYLQRPRQDVQLASMLFSPSLEAVRILSVKSGELLYTLVPAELKMPVEVTALTVCPLTSTEGTAHTSTSATTTSTTASHVSSEQQLQSIAKTGWLCLVGYSNGFVAVFSCSATNNYGKPMCRFYAQGHKVDTNVLALAVDPQRTYLVSAGQDTDIVVWDLASQEASYRLRGHRGGIVGLSVVSSSNMNSSPATQASVKAARPAQPGQHAAAARSGGGGSAHTYVISASADGLLKVWDVALRQCVQTVVASDTQVTSMVIDSQGKRVYCGLRESYLKVYAIRAPGQSVGEGSTATGGDEGGDVLLVDHGTVARKQNKPVTSLRFSADESFLLACTSHTVEVFRALSAAEVRKKVYRKVKRRRGAPSAKTSGKAVADEDDEDDMGLDEEPLGTDDAVAPGQKRAREGDASAGIATSATATEELALLRTFFLTQKIRGACFVPQPPSHAAAVANPSQLHIAVSYNNNNIQTFTTELTTSALEGAATWTLTDLKLHHSFEERGHQTDVRALTFVDNDGALLSMSKEKVLLWTLSARHEDDLERQHLDNHDFYDAQEANLMRTEFNGTLNRVGCIAGLEEVTSMAAINSNVCCIGQADGTVLLADVASSTELFRDSQAHMGGVKYVTKLPDQSGFLTVGADRRLVVWTVGLVDAEEEGQKSSASAARARGDGGSSSPPQRVTLLQSREVELVEFPLFAEYSPDNRYLGVGLQNNSIQLFFADTLKPYLILYGHKLPPTSLDFSTDGTLVASVGMDKSLRFWGTDFGDCHRAIHAHDDYITQVRFLPNTHYVFTVSMDGSVKQWDGDNWAMVQLFRQHQRGLWCIAVTVNDTCVATAGADKCIRCFLRTQGIVFPEEEEEKLAQEAMDEETARRQAMQRLDENTSMVEVGVVGQATAATSEAAERIMEALDLISVEQQRKANPEDTSAPHPLLANRSEWEYLWTVMESIRPSEFRHALSSLTSIHIDALLDGIVRMIETGAVLNYELAAKAVLALVTPAPGSPNRSTIASALHGEVSEAQGARRLAQLRQGVSRGLDRQVSRLDYASAGLQFVRQYLEDSAKVKFFDMSKIQGHKKKYHSRAL